MRVRRRDIRRGEGDVCDEEHHLLGQQDLSVSEQECGAPGNRFLHVQLFGGLPNDGPLKVTVTKIFYGILSGDISVREKLSLSLLENWH